MLRKFMWWLLVHVNAIGHKHAALSLALLFAMLPFVVLAEYAMWPVEKCKRLWHYIAARLIMFFLPCALVLYSGCASTVTAHEESNPVLLSKKAATGYEYKVYSAPWCGPCRALKAQLKDAGARFSTRYVETLPDEVDEFPTCYRRRGNGVWTRVKCSAVTATTGTRVLIMEYMR